ncbi:MAG: cyclic nucleotide-binding domain-containing protein [Elusimicrobia bacterium]|nr:cyclic nucleotide-binding domain-containing protein [Elusimicrobiota bacterium]
MTITEFLQNHVPFLQGLTQEGARALAQAVQQKHVKQGQTVIFKGVTVEGLHVIATGKVAVFVRPDKNKEWVKAAELGSGDIFGERSILEFTTAGATIKGSAPESLIFVIPQEAFSSLLEKDPDLKARTLALIEARSPKPKQAAATPAQPAPAQPSGDKPAG